MAKTPNNSFDSRSNEDRENRLIFKTLLKFKRPCTRRLLSEQTGLEIATLCRGLFNLTNKRFLLKIAFIGPCTKTNKDVFHYYFSDTIKQDDIDKILSSKKKGGES